MLIQFDEGVRSFHTFEFDIGSVGQRAAKLLAVKVGGLKKKSAIWPWPHLNQSAWIRICPGLNHSQSLMASKFVAILSIDPKFLAKKISTPLKLCQNFKRLAAF